MDKHKRDVLIILGFSLLIIMGFFYYSGYFKVGKFFSISIPTAKQQLKQEYTPLWGSELDEQYNNAICKSFSTCNSNEAENYLNSGTPKCFSWTDFDRCGYRSLIYKGNILKFDGGNGIREWGTTSDYIYLISGDSTGSGSASLEIIPTFKGQEVVLLVGTGKNGGNFYTNGIQYDGVEPNTALTVIKFKPHTFNTQIYDIEVNGLITKEINVGEGLKLSFRVTGTYGGIYIYFIGQKAEFECDLAPDELWIRESFSQPVNIKDLTFYKNGITKFCDREKPFTLRRLSEGEKAIRKEEGIYPFNRGETIPQKDFQAGDIITINYATPNVAGVTAPCKEDEINVKIGGIWTCEKAVPEAETIYRDIPIREVIPITSTNSFIFTTTKTNSFKIGESEFKVLSNNYNCQKPEEGGSFQSPNPSSDCYSSTVEFEGKKFIINDKQAVFIRDNIQVQYFSFGRVRTIDGQFKNELQGQYIFKVDNPMDIDVISTSKVKPKEPATINVIIKNNLPTNDIIIKIEQIAKRVVPNIRIDKKINFPSNEGNNDYDIDINTDNDGLNEIIVQAFYPVEADAYVLLSTLNKIKLYVDISEDDTTIIKEPEPIKPKESFLDKIINFIKNLLFGG